MPEPKTDLVISLFSESRNIKHVRIQATSQLADAGYGAEALELAEKLDSTTDFDEAIRLVQGYCTIVTG